MKTISVIIPVFNAMGYLNDLFACLDKCSLREGDQILLVDNGSTDGSDAFCAEAAQRSPFYQALRYTDKADSYAARNYALDFARGDILVFTDSDCKPVPGWLDEIRSRLAPGQVMAGRIELEVVENNIWEHYDSITHLGQSQRRIQEGLIATANMAVHRADFDLVGRFEERFSGGDFDWSKRAGAKGLKTAYFPEALVYHPTRKTYAQTLQKEKRIAYGVGKSHKNKNRSLVALAVIYFLKIFNFPTNLRITRSMKERGVSARDRASFHLHFLRIRWAQLVAAVQGYRQVNARTLGIK